MDAKIDKDQDMQINNSLYCRMCGYGRGHFATRLLLGLILLFLVFCLGIIIGRCSAGFSHHSFEHNRMYYRTSPFMNAYPAEGTWEIIAPGIKQSTTTTPLKK